MIRLATPADRDAVYEICLRTADDGQDATPLYADPELAGHTWAGAYLELEPDLAFVLEDVEGVCGYVLGALDTEQFERRAEELWWPPLRARYSHGTTAREIFDIAWIHDPPSTAATITVEYPSHLHIDLLARTQGRGDGRRLLGTLLDALRRHGSTGVHLGVSRGNTRAIGFYRKMGFSTLDDSDPGAITMGRLLSA